MLSPRSARQTPVRLQTKRLARCNGSRGAAYNEPDGSRLDSCLDQRLSELMRRAQDGDRTAYRALLTEAASLVRAFVRRRLRESDCLEDIVQDTLLSIHHHRHV